MENSNQNLQGSITDNIQQMMRMQYQRTDSDDKTVITIKNSGPGEIKYNLFNQGREESWREKTLRAGDTARIRVSDYGNGNTLQLETKFETAAITADNVKKPW